MALKVTPFMRGTSESSSTAAKRDKAVRLVDDCRGVGSDFLIGQARVQQAIDSAGSPPFGSFERVKVSWALAGKHLMHLLRR